ncbi:NAD(P)-dependent oxidoreductase [Bacillus sp. FJAT-49736]|uniref:NAD(P)-dependent oxidoreductase n=1 Tax=Bacillus sp. FJAT-49736 TaxID=2833582 RepID=UPI001BC98224|nr:NAD(P)-dependent oxidoreductase [Bacillus sp. FJAT-49736]MBS4172035.1 NAD(P)-dependent oxidoreductase [Bacillus sp. FJAT-49736]
MEYAIVYGAKQFIGFELCKELLNCGCTVVAIEHDNYLESYDAEKWLEIGRNANLLSLPMNELGDEIDSEKVCFIPFIDFLDHPSEDEINNFLLKATELFSLEKISEHIIIYPSRYYYSHSDQARRRFHDILQMHNKNIKKMVEFYVPTLYGPWQPNSYLFQQLIENKQTKKYADDENDAIFAEDAVKTIISETKKSVNGQKILLKNSKENSWRNCIQFLNESVPISNVKNEIDDPDIQIRTVQETYSYQEGLTMQIECYKRSKQ